MEPYSYNMMRIGILTIWNEEYVLKKLSNIQEYYTQFISQWRLFESHQNQPLPYVPSFIYKFFFF